MSNVFACTLALCAGVAGASADTLRLDTSPYSAGNGGEFTVTQLTGPTNAGLTGYPTDLAPGSFQTFCLENAEPFTPGGTYSFVLNTGAVLGGGGASGGFDALDDRTAFLYTLFRNGTLPGYDYGAGRQASAADLQQAIWFIEDEPGGVNNGFVALANTAVAPSGAWFGVGLGDVRVLNLFDGSENNIQDQLTLLPAPGSLALLGVAGVAAGRRRR